MSSPSYVWEKLYVAIGCLCGDGSLIRLEEDDLTGEIAEDLIFILKWTKHNIINGKIQKEPDELEQDETH
jgi:hypothetical protein